MSDIMVFDFSYDYFCKHAKHILPVLSDCAAFYEFSTQDQVIRTLCYDTNCDVLDPNVLRAHFGENIHFRNVDLADSYKIIDRP